VDLLTPYRRYTARVRYVNVVDVGPYSTPLHFTTLATGITGRRVALLASTARQSDRMICQVLNWYT